MTTRSSGPRFSIVVPAYNEARYLADTLQAVADAAHRLPAGEVEVIVVDNNSTDGTGELAAGLGARVVHEPRRGVCAARQAGAAQARGDIIVSTDADTCPPPDWLKRIDAGFAAADVALVAGPCRYADPPWWARAYPVLLFGAVHAWWALTGRLFYATATNIAIRRTAFPGYNAALTQGGDELDLLRRIRGRGRMVWDKRNAVITSPRRLRAGFVHSLLVAFLVQYLLAYLLNRVFARPLLGTAPAIRAERRPSSRPARAGVFVGMLVAVMALGRYLWTTGRWIAARRLLP